MENRIRRQEILAGKTILGIELGSTRIKAVLIDAAHTPIASGGFDWENRFENNVWTYRLEDVRAGLQAAYADLAADVTQRYGVPLKIVGAIGISAMMHGYLAFGADGELLAPFRTWRNTMTAEAAGLLSETLQFSIPQRWSIAHLYQCMLDGAPHVKDIRFLTTLSGYVHQLLTGRRVLGVGDASGMFPIDSRTNDFDARMMERFDGLLAAHKIEWRLRDVLPEALAAGEAAGTLTEAGARLLDPSGALCAGIPLCPPEGDGGTGMVATNSVAARTGNVSAGTSIFAMLVLERALTQMYPEIDMVTTPAGRPVAMVHCNNGTSDLDAWMKLLRSAVLALGVDMPLSVLYETLYRRALEGDADCGGLLAYNYCSGEHITHFEEGRPLFVRTPDSRFTLENFMRAHLLSALSTLKIGMDLLREREHVRLERMLGHGGLFKTPVVGQRMMAAAMNVPVTVMETAGEGGAWGIALLAAYLHGRAMGETLEDYLATRVFADMEGETIAPEHVDVEGFAAYIERYRNGFSIERAAVDTL